MKIAIIGSGISGLTASYLLNSKHQITIFEKNDYIGGHCRTKDVQLDGKNIAIDTGFTVFNKENYPNLIKLFDSINVKYQPSKMSFGISIQDGMLEYSTKSLNSFFAQRKNIYSFSFWWMIKDIYKFYKYGKKIVHNNPNITVAGLLEKLNLGDSFKNYFLLPIAGSIWNSKPRQILDFPALSFLTFFDKQGLLKSHNQPQWLSVTGGGKEYIKKLTDSFADRIHLSSIITNISREDDHVYITDQNEVIHKFDQVIFACHADQILEILSNPTEEERAILGNIKYQTNKVVLHTDQSFMPKLKECWSSWVYQCPDSKKTSVNLSLTYWMNNLQNIQTKTNVFLTVNPGKNIKSEHILDEHHFQHPIFDQAAIIAQGKIENIQGINKTWFIGAYTGSGFHEDGVISAMHVAQKIGVKIPW